MCHFIHKALHRTRCTQFFEFGRHGRGGHGGLFGGHSPVQQLDQHKAQCIVQAGIKAAPKGRQAQRQHGKFEQRGERHHSAATGRIAQHLRVFTPGAGDVVFTGLGTALGHLGRQHRRVGRNQRTHAASLLAHVDQIGQQLDGVALRLFSQQTVQQRPHAQNPGAQLAQLKHQVDRDAVTVQMGVDRRSGLATGIKPLQVARQGILLCRGGVLWAGQKRILQGLQVGRQGMKRCRFARWGAHAQAQFG